MFNGQRELIWNFVYLQGNDNYVGIAAKDTANALRVLADATRGVAATTDDREVQELVVDSAREVISQSIKLLDEAKKAMNDPENPENQQRLNQVWTFHF